ADRLRRGAPRAPGPGRRRGRPVRGRPRDGGGSPLTRARAMAISAASPGLRLFNEHVERFNAAVRSGDFGPMVAAFTPDAELVFEGIPVGPIHGRDAIAEAYREQPPDDEVEILDVEERDGEVVGRYRWRRGDGPGGEMRLTPADGAIRRLVVTFDGPARPARRFDPYEIRKDFPILATQAHGRPLVYLDSAATSQKPRV